MSEKLKAPRKVSLKTAFYYWLKLGFTGFGGPAAQTAMMHRELVLKRRWISERRFLHALNYCMILPGPEAQQLATYIGWLMHGALGGVMAGVLFILPSLIFLIGLSWVYMTYEDMPNAFLYGLKPAVIAIVLFAAYRIGARSLKNVILWLIAAAALTASLVKLPFPAIILSAGLIGFMASQFMPDAFKASPHAMTNAKSEEALIGDYTPIPHHAKPSWLRSACFLISGLTLAGGLMAYLMMRYGVDGLPSQMALFFTQASLLGFGDAYAIAPYVYQGSVENHGWLNAQQMIDGLALSETLQGPLIMVVAFIGFMGGFAQPFTESESQLAAGIAAACIATFFSLLPSFLFIFLGGPWIEASRHEAKLSAPLVSINAAMTGAILNLALFFAYQIFWPHGFSGHFDTYAAVLSCIALIALFKYKINAIPIIVASSLMGVFHAQ